MNQTERISYIFKSYKFKEISKKKGSIEYLLVDESGNERLVTAMAELNWRKQIHRVRPVYHRESPLVEALANTDLEDTLVVDFSEFNKKHARGYVTSKKISVSGYASRKSHRPLSTAVFSLFENKSRLVHVFMLGSIGIIALAYLLSIFST